MPVSPLARRGVGQDGLGEPRAIRTDYRLPLADPLRMGWCRLFLLVVSGGAGDCSRSADAGIRPGSCQKHGRIPTEATDSGRTPHARWDILDSDYGPSMRIGVSGPDLVAVRHINVPLFRPHRDFPLILNLPNSILTATSPSSPLITQSHRLAGISSI